MTNQPAAAGTPPHDRKATRAAAIDAVEQRFLADAAASAFYADFHSDSVKRADSGLPQPDNGFVTAALAAQELGRELLETVSPAEIATAFAVASVVFGQGQICIKE